jgi:chromosome segregation ATPase
MKRELTFGAIGLLFLAACNQSPAKEQEAARNAQAQADEKSAQYRMQAEQKSAEEQAKANDKSREAARTLDQEKNEYRQKAQSDLDSLTKQNDDLKAKSAKATGKTRADIDHALADATSRRDAIDAQVRAIDQASADQIETVKAHLDDQIAQLRQSVNEAAKRI